jgi:predicted RNA-binding protein YlxR (DUF448 family)
MKSVRRQFACIVSTEISNSAALLRIYLIAYGKTWTGKTDKSKLIRLLYSTEKEKLNLKNQGT